MHKLELSLEEPERVFFSGDDIRGQVIVNLAASLAVQAVTVKFIGEACVSVPEGLPDEKISRRRKNVTNKICPIVTEGSKEEIAPLGWMKTKGSPHKNKKLSSLKLQQKTSFTAQEKYFYHIQYLYGHKYSSYREQLWAGSHVFPFQFTLPAQLPPSFNGRFGYIRYYCETTLLRWKLKDTRRMYFSVTNISDINTEAKAETVSFQTATGSRKKEDERKVLEVSRGKILPGTSLSWGSAGIRLPPLPPTSFTLDSCKIISIHYRIDVIMFVKGEKEPLTLKLPIIIGNIPLKKHFPFLVSAEEETSSTAQPTVVLPKQITHRYSTLPSVTSEESVNPAQSDCVYKLPNFKPRYLVYTPKSTV